MECGNHDTCMSSCCVLATSNCLRTIRCALEHHRTAWQCYHLNYVTHLGVRTVYLKLSDDYAAEITCIDTLYFVSMLRGILWCCTRCQTYHRIALWSRWERNPHSSDLPRLHLDPNHSALCCKTGAPDTRRFASEARSDSACFVAPARLQP